MKMQESPEDYLEAILVLSRELGNVRSIDVAIQHTMMNMKPHMQ